jgi:hypothetical protein
MLETCRFFRGVSYLDSAPNNNTMRSNSDDSLANLQRCQICEELYSEIN